MSLFVINSILKHAYFSSPVVKTLKFSSPEPDLETGYERKLIVYQCFRVHRRRPYVNHIRRFLLKPLDQSTLNLIWKLLGNDNKSLRERLRNHKVFTKDQCFYLNYHKFSIKSYVVDKY